jgi:multidrug resistance protein, MATE family
MVILAGLISVKHLAAMVVMMNINVAIYMIPLGVQYAVSGLVGKALGEDDPQKAKLIAFHSIRFGGGLLLLIAAAMNVWPEQIASVYT